MNISTSTLDFSNSENIKRYMHLGMKSMIVGNITLACIYLLILNAVATRGFDLELIKADQVDAQKRLELIDIETTIPSSIYALESNEQIQEMPDIGKKIFLSVKKHEMVFNENMKNF